MEKPNKMFSYVSWAMRNYRITFLIMGLMFLFGILGLEKMPKAEFPDFTVRQGVVAAVYPGATSEEVEQQVARPLERYLFTFPEVKRSKTTSTSQNGMCIVMVELKDEVNNKDEVWSKIKHGLNSFRTQLPSGVLALIANDDFGDTSALLIAVESEHRSYRDLKKYSDNLADRLRGVESVSNVRIYGESKEQITLYIDRERLSAYNIGPGLIVEALNGQGTTLSSGSVSGWKKDVPIHVSTTLNNEEQIANQIIYTDPRNNVVRVKDVARIVREYDNSESYIENNGHACVLLSLEMAKGNNIVAYGREVEKVLADYRQQLPDDVTLERIVDQPKVVGASVSDFLINLLESMAIIVIVMMLLFPIRTAIVAGITVPLSTFISVGVMYLFGIPLNTVTLAALIIVLGMVVDNSIVVLDGYLDFKNKGMSRWHAAIKSAAHYFTPMALATACICVIFFPILFTMTGVFGDFVHFLPWTIAINLGVSLVLAVVAIPMLEFALIKQKDSSSDKPKKKSVTDYVQQFYDTVLGWTFRHAWLTIFMGIGIVVGSCLIITPMLKVRLMPVADRDQFAVEITLPEGAGLSQTKSVADSVYNVLKADEDVKSITTFMGCSSPRFQTSYAPRFAGRNYAQFIVNTTSTDATVRVLDRYDPILTEAFPGAYVKFKQLDYQQVPTFEFRFYGDNIDSLHAVANDLIARMRSNPDVRYVHSDYEQPRPIVEVGLDPVTTSQFGLTRTMTQLQLMFNTSKFSFGQVWEDDYPLPIVLADENQEKVDCDEIKNLYISTYVSGAVPVRQIADVEPNWSETRILHRNGLRCITVTAEPKRNVMTAPLQKEFESIVRNDMKLPSGVTFEMGGEPENDATNIPPIALGIGIAVVIIFFFILFNFRRYKLTIVCIVSIALCLPGALLGLLLMNRAIGITAVFGFITLMGMIMRNEILIFEHADGLVRRGWSVRDAAFNAGQRRMIPIFLTTATTAVGVMPMIIAATNFWMPVGVTIFAGGIGSLIMVVTMLPVVYWKLFDKKQK